MFKEMLAEIDRQVVYSIYKIGFVSPTALAPAATPKNNLQFSAPSKESALKSPLEADEGLRERREDKIIKDNSHYHGQKVGRNDLCPCGSGKKFKKCHGK